MAYRFTNLVLPKTGERLNLSSSGGSTKAPGEIMIGTAPIHYGPGGKFLISHGEVITDRVGVMKANLDSELDTYFKVLPYQDTRVEYLTDGKATYMHE